MRKLFHIVEIRMVNNNILTKSVDINKSDNTISAGDLILFIYSFKQMKMSSYDRRLEKRNLERFLDCTNKQHKKERERERLYLHDSSYVVLPSDLYVRYSSFSLCLSPCTNLSIYGFLSNATKLSSPTFSYFGHLFVQFSRTYTNQPASQSESNKTENELSNQELADVRLRICEN